MSALGPIAAKAAWALSNPREATYLARGKLWPSALIRRAEALGRKQGVTRPVFMLSFDCDTDKDIQVAAEVHGKLLDLGIKPIYAVPGELLERGAAAYRVIRDSGAEFLNHGQAVHTVFDEATSLYRSLLFYDKMSREAVRQDIVAGDATLKRVLNVTPKGFRTPHFGSFQRAEEIHFLHSVLKELGYAYSTSTTPYHYLRIGPADRRFGLPELPVCFCPDEPLRILDSWSFRFAPGREIDGEKRYIEQLNKLAALLEAGSALVVNIYADPSQVYDWPEFFETVARFRPFAVESYSDFLASLFGGSTNR